MIAIQTKQQNRQTYDFVKQPQPQISQNLNNLH